MNTLPYKNKISIYVDYFLLPLLVIIVTFQPYYMHMLGFINFHETGIYLPCIDALSRGEVPYRDIFILRGPFEIYFPSFLMHLFGKSLIVLRSYFYIGVVLTLIIGVFLGKELCRTRSFSYFMALVFLAKTFPRVSFANWGGIRFGFGLLALLLMIVFLKKEKSFYLFLAGIVSGISLFVSFEIGIFSGVAIVATLILCKMFGFLKPDHKTVSLFVIGALVVVMPYLFYLAMNGALAPYLDTIFRVASDGTKVFDVPAVLGTPRNLKEFIMALSPFSHNIKYMPPFFLYVGITIWFLRKLLNKSLNKRDLMVICVSIYGAFMYYGAFRDIEGNQYEMALQPAIIVGYVFLEQAFIFCKSKRLNLQPGFKKLLIYLVIGIIPVFSIIYPLRRYRRRFFIFKYAKEFFIEKKGRAILFPEHSHSILELDRAKGVIVPNKQKKEITKIVEYIKNNTTQDEIVFTYPNEGTYNFLTNRPALNRFKTTMDSWKDPEWHKELMNDLKTKRPKYIINRKEYPEIEPFLSKVEPYRKELYDYVYKNYTLVKDIENMEIYEINK